MFALLVIMENIFSTVNSYIYIKATEVARYTGCLWRSKSFPHPNQQIISGGCQVVEWLNVSMFLLLWAAKYILLDWYFNVSSLVFAHILSRLNKPKVCFASYNNNKKPFNNLTLFSITTVNEFSNKFLCLLKCYLVALNDNIYYQLVSHIDKINCEV